MAKKKLVKGYPEYASSINCSSQFLHCGNCFRVDLYRNCFHGCAYCFANNRFSEVPLNFCVADVGKIRRLFEAAIDRGETNTIAKELLNHRVPLHCGGMSDGLQPIEFELHTTLEFIKLTKEYNYPVNFSTKHAGLPQEYWDVLDPAIHTFSISIMGSSEEFVRKFESNTPSVQERLDFVKELHDRGFWVSIRIQPIVDIEEALALIKRAENYVNYFTVEHIKLPANNLKALAYLRECYNFDYHVVKRGREWEYTGVEKIKNIERIKAATKVPIGVGDNDLHTMSSTLNCCGIDTMPPAFSNWLKYNSMYIKMTGDRSQWSPESNPNNIFTTSCRRDLRYVREYVDRHYRETYGNDRQMTISILE